MIPSEPSFRDGKPVYFWRVQWDEECFCHVEAVTIAEAVENAFALMNRRTPSQLTQQPEFVAKVKEWVQVS